MVPQRMVCTWMVGLLSHVHWQSVCCRCSSPLLIDPALLLQVPTPAWAHAACSSAPGTTAEVAARGLQLQPPRLMQLQLHHLRFS